MREPNVEPPILVNAISFRGDGVIEIQYMENSDQGDHVALMKALMFEKNLLDPQVDELLSDITDIIELALDKLKNPPMTRPSGLGV